MKILMVSDFFIPSGYQIICEGIAKGLVNCGHEVTVIGAKYDNREHDYPFTLVPSHYEYLPMHMRTLAEELKPDWIVMLQDIHKLSAIIDNTDDHDKNFMREQHVVACFPVESTPVGRDSWVKSLHKLRMRFTFTQFGLLEMQNAHLPGHVLPVGVDASWYDAPKEELRSFQRPPKSSYVLVVAENQMRKNLGGAFRMAQMAGEYLVLVTGRDNPDGWDLDMLAAQMGVLPDEYMLIDRQSVSRDQLKRLMLDAKCLLLPSLAEGIGLPIYEAQALGCPVVATDCCGITEAVLDKQLLIVPQYKTPYPWGNTFHFWPHHLDGVRALGLVNTTPRPEPKKYPTWDAAASVMTRYMLTYSTMEGGLVKA